MATPAAILSILVKADGIAKTQAQVTGLDKSLDKAGKSGSKSMAGLAKGAGLAGAAFGALAVVGIKKATDAFYESNKIAKQTNAVLKSTGKEAGVTAKQVQNLATALSKKTGIDDEAIQSGENLLLTFTKIRNEAGKGNDIFTQSTKVITDMSVALGQDMKSSAIQVGKALNDPIKGVTALQRVGVSFTAAQKEQIKGLVEHGHALDAQKLILRELNKEFGGSAAAQATNMDRLKVSLGNLQESVGSVFVPVLEKATGALNKFVDGMTSGTGAGGRLVQALKDLGAWLSGAFTAAIATAGAWLHTHRDDLNAVAHAARNVGTAIAWAWEHIALPVVQRVLPAIKQIVQGTFQVIGGLIDVLAGVLTGDFGRAWNGVKAIFEGGVKGALGVFRAMTAPVREAASRIGDALKGALEGAWDGIKNIFKGGINAVIGFLNVLISAINHIPGVNIGKIGKIGGDDKGNPNIPVDKKARGGAFGRTGGIVNSPITLMGEEAPRHPEFVIPTNPAYRGRARGLLGQAASALGMASGGQFGQGSIMDLWTGQNGASSRRLIASAIAMAESGGNANAVSPNPAGGVNRGLWQIWSGNPGSTFDPAGNARTAIRMSGNGSNWGQWEAFTNGAYKQFMGRGRAGGGLPGGGLPSVSDILSKFPSPGDLPGMFQGLGKYVIGKATSYVKNKVGDLFTGQAQPGTVGLGGTITGGLVPQVVRALQYAKGHGWGGRVTSGFRTRAEQAALYARYLAGGPLAAKPGTSSHETGQAVDVTDYGAFGAAMASAPAASRLYNRLGAADPVHFSVSGFKHGGITGSEGLAYLHANEAVIPLAGGGTHTVGARPIHGPSGASAKHKLIGSILGGVSHAGMVAAPNFPMRTYAPMTPNAPAADGTVEDNTESNQALIDAINAATEQQKIHDELVAQQVANQLKIIALTNQGPAILAAVVAAVNGGIGGKVGLGGFQTVSFAGGMARYR